MPFLTLLNFVSMSNDIHLIYEDRLHYGSIECNNEKCLCFNEYKVGFGGFNALAIEENITDGQDI